MQIVAKVQDSICQTMHTNSKWLLLESAAAATRRSAAAAVTCSLKNCAHVRMHTFNLRLRCTCITAERWRARSSMHNCTPPA